MTDTIKVPDIGDFKDVPVIEVHMKPGQIIAAEDALITLESDKATMDVPAPAAGTIGEVKVKIGDKVSAGTVIATSGALTIGVKALPPMPPSDEIVNVAPCISPGVNLPSRALAEMSPSSRQISIMPLRSTSFTTGTTRPSGVSTAMPML